MDTEGEKSGFNELKQTLRKVSVYILHKWSRIFTELQIDGSGISDEDMFPRLSERIFQRLCSWFIDNGDISSKKRRLHSILIDCGAKRGAEEWEKYLTEKVPLDNTTSKYEPKPKPKRKTKLTSSQPRRFSFQQKKTSNVVRHTKKRTRTSRLTISPEKCEIPLKVDVRDIKQDTGQSGNKRTFQKLCLDFYSHILKHEVFHVKLLQGLLDIPGLHVARVMPNNLYVHIKCPTLGAFSTLMELNRTGRLSAICHTALVTNKVLEAVGVSRIMLSVFIEPEVVLRAKKILLSRKCLEPVVPSVKYRLQATEAELMINDLLPNWDSDDCVDFTSDKWLDDACSRSNHVRHQYKEFEVHMTDFIRILHISNPVSGVNILH
ncbi:hypothetical protein ScPMuIL_004332 [Solemya velum]